MMFGSAFTFSCVICAQEPLLHLSTFLTDEQSTNSWSEIFILSGESFHWDCVEVIVPDDILVLCCWLLEFHQLIQLLLSLMK